MLAGIASSTSVCWSMLFQVWSSFKLHPTVGTAVWFNITMNKFMHPHTAIAMEFLVTHGTFKRQFIGVLSVMFMEIFLTSETSVTFITHECLICCMTFIMPLHSTHLSKSTTTQWTLIRFFTCMNSHMCVKILSRYKTLGTNRTFVRFLASVTSNMHSQSTGETELFIAILAWIFLLICMYGNMWLQISCSRKILTAICTFVNVYARVDPVVLYQSEGSCIWFPTNFAPKLNVIMFSHVNIQNTGGLVLFVTH